MDDSFSQFACSFNSRGDFIAVMCNNYKKFETIRRS